MQAFITWGRYVTWVAAASVVLLGCSQNSPMGSLSSQAPAVRAFAALVPGANATFEQRAAASGVSPECYLEGSIANQNAGAVGQELQGFVPNAKCLGIKQISEVGGTRVKNGSAFSPQSDYSANQPAACVPANAIALSRGEGSVGEMKIFFGSFANRSPVILPPSIANNSLPSGAYSVAISGDSAVIRVRLSASLPLEKFAIRSAIATAFGERLECQFVVDAAPVAPQPIKVPEPIPEVIVAVPAPDAQEEAPAEEPAGLPAPEGEAPVVAEEPAPAPVVAEQPAPAPVEEQPAPAPVVEQPVAEQPAPEVIPEPPVVVVLPPSEPYVVDVPSAPAEEAPAPVEEAPVANNPPAEQAPAPDFQTPVEPEVVSEPLPPVVLSTPPVPQPVEPLPPVVLTPMEEGPSRNPAAAPVVNNDDQEAEESDDLDGSLVDGNDEAPAGGNADSSLQLSCLGNPTVAAGEEAFVQLQLNRALTRRERRNLRAIFRIHDRLEGLLAERVWTGHLRSLRLRLRAPQAVGFLHRSAVEVSVGGASAACQVTFTPSYRDDADKLVLLKGGYCGLASIGAYSAVLDKNFAEAEVFFAAQVSNNRDSVSYSVVQGAIDLNKDVVAKISGPFSQKIRVARRSTSGVLGIQYAYRVGAEMKTESCTLSVAPLEAIASEPPPAYVGKQGLVGAVYQLKANTQRLYTRATLDRMTPSAPIFMSMIDVSARKFSAGFPGVKDLFEWFQLRIGRVDASEKVPNVRIFLPETTDYQFKSLSDDGFKLYIDGKLVIDHDGLHAPSSKESAVLRLEAGFHDLAIDYFQGPRFQIAAFLEWRSRGKSNGEFNLTSSYKLIPAAAFFTDPQGIAVTAY